MSDGKGTNDATAAWLQRVRDAAYALGLHDGARDMRERCADAIDLWGLPNDAERIRALPLDPERVAKP